MTTLVQSRNFLHSKVARSVVIIVLAITILGVAGICSYSGAMPALFAYFSSAPSTSPEGSPADARAPGPETDPETAAGGAIFVHEDKLSAMKVQVEVARHKGWDDILRLTGQVELNAELIAHVSPLVNGVIREVPVELGQKVSRGDVLAYIDSREVGEAKLRLVQDKVHLQTVQQQYQWHNTVNKNTMALLEILDTQKPAGTDTQSQDPSLVDIEKMFHDKLIGQSLAKIMAAYVEFKRAESELKRLQKLVDESIVAGKKAIEARAAYKTAQSTYYATLQQVRFESQQQLMKSRQQLHQAQAALAIARSQLLILGYTEDQIEKMDPIAEGRRVAYYPVCSPMDGTIISKHTLLSQRVSAETNLMEIADLSFVWLRADVFEKDMNAVRGLVGKEIAFETDGTGEKQFTAKVFSLGNHVCNDTRASGLLAVVENPQRLLKPGMFARIALNTGHDSGVLQLPTSAVQHHKGADFVFVRETACSFSRRDVELGRSTARHAEIRGGISPGDEVVIQGAFALKSEMLSELMAEE